MSSRKWRDEHVCRCAGCGAWMMVAHRGGQCQVCRIYVCDYSTSFETGEIPKGIEAERNWKILTEITNEMAGGRK